MKILVIGIEDKLQAHLAAAGFMVISECVEDVDELDQYVQAALYEAVLVDFDATDVTPKDVLRLRTIDIMQPLIGLKTPEPRSDLIDERVSFLKSGGDDFFIKPVGVEVISATLQARLRRMHRMGTDEYNVMCGKAHIKIDIFGRRLFVNNRVVALTAKETCLLEELTLHRNEVVKYSDLLDTLYQTIDAEPDSNVLQVWTNRIRNKSAAVHKDAWNIIETVRGIGYRIVQSK